MTVKEMKCTQKNVNVIKACFNDKERLQNDMISTSETHGRMTVSLHTRSSR